MTKPPPITVAAGVALAVLLAGCAGQVVKSPPVVGLVCDAASALSEDCSANLAALVARTHENAWSMQGRAAISSGKQAGNARIDWQQRGAQDYSVTLSAPITRQSWQLDVAQGNATLTGLEGGPRSGADATVLLREFTQLDIPVDAMRFWLRGVPAVSPAPTRHVFDASGRLTGLAQDGWRIDFEKRRADGLPGRITATRGDSRVRLVIDQWSDAAGE